MKICFKISLIWLLSQVDCWKPISHPAAYTVYQTFSDHANEPVARSSNALQKNSVDTLLDSFNKNDFSNDVSSFTEKRNVCKCITKRLCISTMIIKILFRYLLIEN